MPGPRVPRVSGTIRRSPAVRRGLEQRRQRPCHGCHAWESNIRAFDPIDAAAETLGAELSTRSEACNVMPGRVRVRFRPRCRPTGSNAVRRSRPAASGRADHPALVTLGRARRGPPRIRAVERPFDPGLAPVARPWPHRWAAGTPGRAGRAIPSRPGSRRREAAGAVGPARNTRVGRRPIAGSDGRIRRRCSIGGRPSIAPFLPGVSRNADNAISA